MELGELGELGELRELGEPEAAWVLQNWGEQGLQNLLEEREEEREGPLSLELGERLLQAQAGAPEGLEEGCWGC